MKKHIPPKIKKQSVAQEQKEAKKIDVKLEVRKLIKRGRDQGFVTQDEILNIFPQPEFAINEIDELFHRDLILPSHQV